MSERSEITPPRKSKRLDVETLSYKVYKKLTFPLDRPIPVAAHCAAGAYMLAIRDAMLRGQELSQAAKSSLLCAGTGCMRRIVCESDDESGILLMKTTQALIFSLLAFSEPNIRAEDIAPSAVENEADHEKEDGVGNVEELDGQMLPKRQRCNIRDSEQLLLAWKAKSLADKVQDTRHADSSWATELKSDAAVSRAALKEAQHLSGNNKMADLYDMSKIFFRCTSSAMASSMLCNVSTKRPADEAGSSFLTLDVVGMLNDANETQEEKLKALADAAESESGQSVLRDLILSFKLPQQAVSTRRTVVLSRESNSTATKQYPEVVNVAHEAAMRGAMWTYEEDPDEVHKICALLAGYALVLVKNKDEIRKGNAFGGRVSLSFLDGPSPPPSVTRLTLLPETNEWVVYSLNSRGKPNVKCRKSGYTGFCECLLLVSTFTK